MTHGIIKEIIRHEDTFISFDYFTVHSVRLTDLSDKEIDYGIF